MVLTLTLLERNHKRDHSNESTAQYFPVALFIMLFKMVLIFQSVDEMLNQRKDSATRKRCKRIASYFEAHYCTFFTNFAKAVWSTKNKSTNILYT